MIPRESQYNSILVMPCISYNFNK